MVYPQMAGLEYYEMTRQAARSNRAKSDMPRGSGVGSRRVFKAFEALALRRGRG